MNVGDVDYASHETSLGPNWLMKWRIGLRTCGSVFRFARPTSRWPRRLPAAASSSAALRTTISGIGPHAGLELRRQANPWGLGLVGKLDGGLLFGQVEQEFVRVSTTGASTEIDFTNQQQVPMLSGFLGLDWRPPCHPNLDILFGYHGGILVERGPHERSGHLQRHFGR